MLSNANHSLIITYIYGGTDMQLIIKHTRVYQGFPIVVKMD